MIVWIAQTPFDIPFFWTHKKLKDFYQSNTCVSTKNTCFNKTSIILKFGFVTLFCCVGWIGNDGNIGRWVAMMYRVIVSLTFSSIVAQIGGESKLEDRAITYLIVLTAYMPLFFSLFTLFVVNVEVVKFLVETINCSEVDEDVDGYAYGNKAIIIAAQLKYVELMKYLIGKSCNCNMVSIHGNSPLHYGAANGILFITRTSKQFKYYYHIQQ